MENLNMLKTEFSQRSNSDKREPELLKLWENTFEEVNKSNTGDVFVLHDGPPYANGDVHVGHVLNKVLKDMVSKYYLMSNYKVDFRPGFDCHGLPTELGVQKKFGKNLNDVELREKCRDWANLFSEKQKESFKKLGVLADWKNVYKTMDKNYEFNQLKVLYNLLNTGNVYLDKRPVYYSPSSKTVLAEFELEYKPRKDKSAYFALELENGTNLLCWTTQPWTLLGNVAACVNGNLTYCEVLSENKKYLLSKSCLNLFNNYEVLNEYKGSDLYNMTYLNKLTNKKGVVLVDSFVKDGSGTGVVHLCPAHGEEDYNVCKNYNLYGEDLTDSNGNVDGMFCLDECSNYVLYKLQEMDTLFKCEEYTHQYPHDWRTGLPVYYKMSEQFFLNLEDLKNKSTSVLNNVDMSEDKWKNRMLNMLSSRDRWCLSRQRKWGFPFAVFLKDNLPFLNKELENHLLSLFKEKGSDVWFNLSEDELLPENFKNLGLKKCEYTMDVWFDSGVSWLSVLNGEKADLYLEGSDQHRGWFQSSLLTSVSVKGDSPYKKVLTHGFVLDENGRKMSKSLNNVVLPSEVQKEYNTDVLRLWVSVVNYSDDVSLGKSVLKNCANYYFKLRNTLRYLLGNMYGFDENYNPNLNEKDRLAMERCDKMYNNVLKNYSDYSFRKSFDDLMEWVSDFSSNYLDLETKSNLYENDLKSDKRLRTQYVLKYCFEKYVKALAPMCSFLSEDAYQNYEFRKFDSVFKEKF